MPEQTGSVGAVGDQAATVAFQLGWDMSRLYRVASTRRPVKYTPGAKLLSQRDFGGSLNTERRLAGVSSGLGRLSDALGASSLARPSMRPLLSLYLGQGTKDQIQEAAWRLHLATLITVQAADPRLGSAYNLGRALGETATTTDLSQLKKSFDFYRVNGLRQELEQLASSFPPHAARAVAYSLCLWQCIVTPRLKKGAAAKGPEEALPRQAEVWRTLLAGERLGSDRLAAEDYVSAAKKLVTKASRIARGVIRSYWRGLTLSLLFIVGGIAVAIAVGGAVAVVSGIGAAASALGISWKGVASTFTSLAGNLRAPLWGAELDLSIARAITVPEARKAYAQLPADRQRCEAGKPLARPSFWRRLRARLTHPGGR